MTQPESLRTEARIERTDSGWSIHLPLRREEITLDKRTVVAECVVIRRARVHDVERVQRDVKHERLRVDASAVRHDLDATQPIDTPRPHDTLAGTGMEQDPLC
jgi:stress response protein YsnF